MRTRIRPVLPTHIRCADDTGKRPGKQSGAASPNH
jgi:hypothetical protein